LFSGCLFLRIRSCRWPAPGGRGCSRQQANSAPVRYDSPRRRQSSPNSRPFRVRHKLTTRRWSAAAGGGLRAHQLWNDQISRKTRNIVLIATRRAPCVRSYSHSSPSGITCREAKYTYWAIRPCQFDPDIKPVFATPHHSSYPAAHACPSISVTRALSYLFPRDVEALAKSRVWAGIHYRRDIVAGRQLTIAVADKRGQNRMVRSNRREDRPSLKEGWQHAMPRLPVRKRLAPDRRLTASRQNCCKSPGIGAPRRPGTHRIV